MKQKPKTLKLTDPVEAAVVDQIVVRLITPEEKTRWNERVTEHHHLKNAQKASVWQRVGATADYLRAAEDFYVAHDRPKQLSDNSYPAYILD